MSLTSGKGNKQPEQAEEAEASNYKASITVVFDDSDRETSRIAYENWKQIMVKRQSGFKGHKHTQQDVQNLFWSVQLNIDNPNLVIIQGRITKVLPLVLQATLEHIYNLRSRGFQHAPSRNSRGGRTAGTRMFKAECKGDRVGGDRDLTERVQKQRDAEKKRRLGVHGFLRGIGVARYGVVSRCIMAHQFKPAPLYILDEINASAGVVAHAAHGSSHPHMIFESPIYRRVVDRRLVFRFVNLYGAGGRSRSGVAQLLPP
ncbi:hypothetical protein BDP27DRAFT_1433251 [Rhodocollybia butyracea]|uniref:Uncharacterized protein n=1 Tax=Rhodocollybia butyracea TaxID=206335 RepID=A0A9P5P7Z9_9AGAR|nr:hypothetical protein BDP27DRAFT_1433251 [Rhodocollybia butyracea]